VRLVGYLKRKERSSLERCHYTKLFTFEVLCKCIVWLCNTSGRL